MKEFEYFKEIKSNDSLTIDNLGNCCIKAFNDNGNVYYLQITTSLGFSTILEYGPLNAETLDFNQTYMCSYKVVEFSEKVLSKIVDNFLNDKYRKITQAFKCESEEFKNNYRNIL